VHAARARVTASARRIRAQRLSHRLAIARHLTAMRLGCFSDWLASVSARALLTLEVTVIRFAFIRGASALHPRGGATAIPSPPELAPKPNRVCATPSRRERPCSRSFITASKTTWRSSTACSRSRPPTRAISVTSETRLRRTRRREPRRPSSGPEPRVTSSPLVCPGKHPHDPETEHFRASYTDLLLFVESGSRANPYVSS
jgi:hypothetical protein